jgi:hypothetical protein
VGFLRNEIAAGNVEGEIHNNRGLWG